MKNNNKNFLVNHPVLALCYLSRICDPYSLNRLKKLVVSEQPERCRLQQENTVNVVTPGPGSGARGVLGAGGEPFYRM